MFSLETERLRLRELELSDFDDLYEILGDPIAMQFYPDPLTREQAMGWLTSFIEDYAERGYGMWAVTLKESGVFVGECGLLVQPVEGQEEIEIAYHFQRAHWGHGYASEAARACRDYAFKTLAASRVCSLVSPENLPSLRVATHVHQFSRLFHWEKINEPMLYYWSEPDK